MKTEIVNARIESTVLGIEDHGILTFILHCAWPGEGCGFGGFRLDVPEKNKLDSGGAFGAMAIRAVLETVGVEKWEDLKGKYLRVETEGWGGGITRIGNITENKWLDLKALASEYQTG